MLTTSRRDFVGAARWIAVSISGLSFIATAREEKDPFDFLPESVWKNSRQNGLIMIHRAAPKRIFSHAQITSDAEPGRPLVIRGHVFAPDGRTPVQGVTVYAYNTDAAGYYGFDRKEYPPRLYGWMKTDAAGQFELRTIYPGHYPAMHVPAHIHFTLWSEAYPPQWAEELRFQGDAYITKEMLATADMQGDFSSIQPLTIKDGILQCRYNIRLSSETNFR